MQIHLKRISIRLLIVLFVRLFYFTAAPVALALQTPQGVPGDRWMEIDLYWFSRDQIQHSANEFWDRFAPLYAGVQGDRGIVLNIGWTVQYIMDWSGNLDQRIVLPTGSGEQPWVAESAPLSGDWRQMQEAWKARFMRPINVQKRGYQPWTYGDLRKLITALREAEEEHGIHGIKVGSLTYASRGAYGEDAPWARRHPEAFNMTPQTVRSGIFDPGALLHADSQPLGGLPEGIREGMPVHRAFAAQWGSLSKSVGLDAIMLRDAFGMPFSYRRDGPFGPVAPSPEISRSHNVAVATLVRETKLANPQALVMMYSNGASAISDWRSNCFDLESIAKEGYLDIFVDQTWAGAWNEVGVRNQDFWNQPGLGYTYQLAYLLAHAAILADTKVRHYSLTETFDSWESWDVLHSVPERLRWEIWAYAHAGVKTPNGLKLPAGSYISWGNQGQRLLSEKDVNFLASNSNEAALDAHRTVEIFGPTLVYSRETMFWQMEHASPDNDIKEWIDEQAGSVMKWPLPILSSTRLEWLPEVHSDLYILQTPVHLSAAHTNMIARLIRSGQPIAIWGSPLCGIAPELARLGGLGGIKSVDKLEQVHDAKLGESGASYANNIPASFPTLSRLSMNRNDPGTFVVYSINDSPALTLDTNEGKQVLTWDPPTFFSVGVWGASEPKPGFRHPVCCAPLLEVWGGSAAPYALTAGALNSLLSRPKVLHARSIDMNQTTSICAWRTFDNTIHMLAANLEEGIRDDADRFRHVVLVLPSSWNHSSFRDEWSERRFGVVNQGEITINLDHAQSVMLTNAR